MVYQLIALDMDGTLLNSQFKITKGCQEAIKEASDLHKIVAISTGRSLTEMRPYLDDLKDVRYLILESGAVVYDLKEAKILYQKTFQPSDIYKIHQAYLKQDMMIHIFMNGYSYATKEHMYQMDKYQMGKYQETFVHNNSGIENVDEFLKTHLYEIEKVNLYHQSPQLREESITFLKDLDVTKACVEVSSLELSPKDVHKGVGLVHLCEELQIPINQTIAVGDSHNDKDIMEIAGLAVAMNNAIEEIKAIADEVVADCDHDGVKEAIEKYLIKGAD